MHVWETVPGSCPSAPGRGFSRFLLEDSVLPSGWPLSTPVGYLSVEMLPVQDFIAVFLNLFVFHSVRDGTPYLLIRNFRYFPSVRCCV